MISGFKTRAPWTTIPISIFAGPFIVFLYLNRAIIALAYLGFSIFSAALIFILCEYNFIPFKTQELIEVFSYPIIIVGAVHSYIVAKNKPLQMPLKFYSRSYGLLIIIIALAGFPLAFRTYGFEPFSIPSNSMSPNFKKGDIIFSNKFIYHSSALERGDVITFKVHGNVDYIKRIIGLPNDTVQIKNGTLYICDKEIEKVASTIPNHYVETLPEGQKIEILDMFENQALDNTPLYHVPENHYFVLGDNRDQSDDSRHQETIGFIPAENITGRVSELIWNGKTKSLSFGHAQQFKTLKTN